MQMNQDIKMVFVDLDGTLLRGVRTVTEHTREAFRRIREAGIIPVICTGRPGCESDFAARAIGAEGYLIASNGGEVYVDYSQNRLLYQVFIGPGAVRQVLDVLQTQKEPTFYQVYIGGRSYTERSCAHLIGCCWDAEHAEFFSGRQTVVPDLNDFFRETGLKTNKFFVGVECPEQLGALRERLKPIPGIVTYASGARLLEILPENVDKRRGVRAVMAAEGVTRGQIMAIGDSENDLGMFEEAALCVAMGNACAQLRGKADEIAPPCTEDGAAWAVEKLLL